MSGRDPRQPSADQIAAGRDAYHSIVMTFGRTPWFRGASLRWDGSQMIVFVYGNSGDNEYVPVPRGASLPSKIGDVSIYVGFPPDQARFTRPPDCRCKTMECGPLGTICAPCPSFMADYHHPLNQGTCHQEIATAAGALGAPPHPLDDSLPARLRGKDLPSVQGPYGHIVYPEDLREKPFHGTLYLTVWYDAQNWPVGARICNQLEAGPLVTGGGMGGPVVTHAGTRPIVLRSLLATGSFGEAKQTLLNAVRTDPELQFLQHVRLGGLYNDLRGIVIGRPLLIGNELARIAPLAKRSDWS